ncbi:UDP-N-acetylmuramoyl-L-alanyl-D-glutamate--2,6-diaminopimelate ligase [Roseobacter sp. N2S]|uniref:UDP-N-acetylmuramoyl-L-alanyl-D-glutamate--2, 6-diaminopimelate ligase n=1 Tax=Roseobacter sp. N2S TaxID=2663844 RepID=UPI002856456E|nr:UDP-N-acetylmuramoyl-L-alanyl-D-glutamate--2,6-diaminopimelate ligase [Roseobacter sp. N2S]MDR6264131.1 UDP-N-acetylmuramoyl-L-alanyl-D-glutamate--2,6-diaminopimelate ligase [Roseobacter sp. N2S]
MTARTLQSLGLTATHGPQTDIEINGICVDSRACKAGDLFAAMPGSLVHGGTFIQYALRMGASAILTDAEGHGIALNDVGDIPVPVIVNDDPRRALAMAAARFYGAQPATMVAVTGTNGKTSVANFTRQIWELLGYDAVNFGTTGVEGAYSAPMSHTTPEPVTLHKLLKTLESEGITHAAMEASSHGLDQRRLDGVWLTAAAYTNFTQDHLDYHDTFEAYFNAKAGLFSRVLPPEGSAVINIDDAKGAELVKIATARGQDVVTIGTGKGDLQILSGRFDATGQEVRFSWRGEVHAARLNLIGGFQAQNVLTAAALTIACGAQSGDVFRCLPELQTVPGRMQLAATRANGASVFVDFAHTPDALKTALRALRPHVLGRLIVVFGAGGDRDTTKRPLMGIAARDNADVVFVTDDNPRSEDPAAIRRMVLTDCPEATEVGDRAYAILAGVDALQPGDALLIAGKGHEKGQIVGDDVLPFDDVEQASVAVHALDGLGA